MQDKVASLMRRGAVTCADDTPVRAVAQIMVVNRTAYCVVLDQKHEVIGHVSLRSVLEAFGPDLDEKKARDVLVRKATTVTPRTSIKEAIDLMNRDREEHLVVVSDRPDSKAVVGLLRAKDIIKSMVTPREVMK